MIIQEEWEYDSEQNADGILVNHASYYVMVEQSRQMEVRNRTYRYWFVRARIWRIKVNVISRVYKYKRSRWSAMQKKCFELHHVQDLKRKKLTRIRARMEHV